MILLRADNLGKSFGQTVLFSGVGFVVQEKQRLGLIGVNGSGKTTLMRILCRQEQTDSGQISLLADRKIGYLAQHASFDPEKSLYDETLTVFSDLIEAETELAELHAAIDADPDNLQALVVRQAALYESYQHNGGLTYRARTRSTLLGMGFLEQDLVLPMSALSGGQASKVQMAKLLLSRADLLMLDEPTNHLDIGSVEWLESYLLEYPGSMIIISHDRYFLDKVTTGTLELENGHLEQFDGNYTAYLAKKREQREIEQKHYQQTQKEIVRMEEMIARFRSWNRERSVRTAEHKEHQLQKLRENAQKPENEPMAIRFSLTAKQGGGQDVLIAEGLQKSFDGKMLFSGVNLHIRQGERVFLLGPNGCGKTTLIRVLLGQIAPDQGSVRLGANIVPGYYDQFQSTLDAQDTPVTAIQNAYPAMNDTQARNALAAFLFRGDDVFKPIAALSGGERARVELLRLMLGQYNFLMLDEPTNHLDAPSREALESALLEYEGTVLAISHDRYLVNRLATRVIALSAAGLFESIGNYDDYVAHLCSQSQQAEAAPAPKQPTESAIRRDNAAALRRTRAQLRKAEDDIARLEVLIAEKEALLAGPEIASDYQRILEESAALGSLKAELDASMDRWEELYALADQE